MDIKNTYFSSQFGFWIISTNELYITSIKYQDQQPSFSKDKTDILDASIYQLKAYFDGKLKKFDLPLNTQIYSPFFQEVWKELIKVPFGKTTTYSAIAKQLHNPKAIRAVGMANAKNPFPIVIPCHRVIGKDKSLTGYASGIKLKRQLLEHEGAWAKQLMLF